ncbi:MAG: topoisomerase DNA-binding C4 zinc finger domain-containing protein [Desulfovibrio sp.]|nr:topoisomerase DNA-binding C4 zinc finger domain-containing protein [Desulfovibrio sp.]
MPIYYCPLCQAPLKRRSRKNNPKAFFWSCTGFRQGCHFCCDDFQDSPFLLTCPQCGHLLHRRISKKTGRPYVACFNKSQHANQQVLFFHDDGTPSHLGEVNDHPKAKAVFSCPECHAELLYRRVHNGKYAGQKNIFLCPNTEGHKDARTHFFEDQDGEPLL